MSGRAEVTQTSRIDPGRALYKLQQQPKKVLDSARRGSIQDLVEVANFWPSAPNAPELLSLGVVDVFLTHLDGTLVPALNSRTPSMGTRGGPAIDKAWISLAGLSKIGTFLYEPQPGLDVEIAEKNILEKWGHIYKWCSFFYSTKIGPVPVSSGRPTAPTIPPQVQRSALDLIPGVLYALSRSENLRRTMVDTPGTVEMATRMWILEDECPVPTSQDIPVCTAALDGLLRFPDISDPGKLGETDVSRIEQELRLELEAIARRTTINKTLDRVVKTAGGSARNVIQLLLSRLKNITSTPQIATPYSAINLDLIGHLSRSPNHELRMGFLSEGLTKMCTKLAVTICGMLDSSPGSERARIGFGGSTLRAPMLSPRDENLLGAMVSAIGFLVNTLESTDGFSWVNMSLSAGLLTVWTGAAKYMKYMHPEDADMVMMILREILPRYLVYRSVVLSVKTQATRLRDQKAAAKRKSMSKADKGKANWDLGKRKGEGDELDMVQWTPEARGVWRKFEKLALERYIVSLHMKCVKGKAVTCDNVECQRTDTKNNFMKCGGCGTSLYCSRECQTIAWKKGGHKNVCKMKQTEVAEGKYEIISKPDADFFHHLSTRDARHNMPLLRRMAKASYPDLAPTALVICIDYLEYPTKFSVHPLADHEKHSPMVAPDASANAEARNEELINRAREHPGKFGIVQSKITNGQGMQLVLSVVPGIFWDDAGWTVDEDGDVDYRAEEDDDEEEEEAFLKRLNETGSDGMDIDDAEKFLGQQPDGVEMLMARMTLNNVLKAKGFPPLD